ncbi:ras and EF-hand domain-containing protein-like isoform X1 [Clupea harengus]|uniref:Ras and EF-hand domain-containing protein-like isoform X1 n=1 Tax=Clupea harengus TaxID=7950 RepID=A0A6P3W813_CLUHA|nr:ras and EF-hand domain-containing protein-like isoform X1 [Clupea harengus]
MGNTHRRRLSASEVKNESELLNKVDGVCSLLNQLNTEDKFLLYSHKAEETYLAHATNISDEVNEGLSSVNIRPKSRRLVNLKEWEDSLDCDGGFLRWYKEITSGQMTDLEVFLKAQEEEKQQLETCLAFLKGKHVSELADSHAEINALRQENEHLTTALLKAQAEVTRIQTQLDKLKQEFMAQENAEIKERVSPNPLTGQIMGMRSPLGVMSRVENIPMGLWSNCRMSSKRRDNIPGSMMPTRKRILILFSGLSDSESVLDVNESDRDFTQESDEDTTDPQTTSEGLSVESSCSSSGLLCQRKPLHSDLIQPAGVLLSGEEKSGPMYRLVLAGDVGSGKSSFLLRLSQHQFKEDMQSTVGVDCKMKRMLVDGKRMALQIWDTAGHERFHSISGSYFRKAHGILLLYDITSEQSFLNIPQWLEQIEAYTGTSVPICLVGNKVDLRGGVPDNLCVSSACGMRLATNISQGSACAGEKVMQKSNVFGMLQTSGALFFETSAKDGTSVVEAVLHLAREVKKVDVPINSTLQLTSVGDRDSTAGNCCWA